MIISELHKAIELVCPIHGISSDGRIDFKEEATEEQKATAQAIMSVDLPSLDGIPTPPIPTLSKIQFLLMLPQIQIGVDANNDPIFLANEAEVESGVIPSKILAIFSQLTAQQQFVAKTTFNNMTQVSRHEPLVDMVASAYGITSTQVDDYFRNAGAL